MYLQVAIKFRIASTLANSPIFSRISSGSMNKAKESFDTEIGSEASIKGVNSICICFGEEEAFPCFNNRGWGRKFGE